MQGGEDEEMLKSWKPYIVILIVFMVIRLVLWSVSADDYLYRLPKQDDAPVYLKMAQIWQGETSYKDLNLSPFVRVPGYAWMAAGVQAVAGRGV